MLYKLRQYSDRSFTVLATGSILLMVAALVIVLGPIFVRGMGAVFFTGTVEFEKMQLVLFKRGNLHAIEEQEKQVAPVRAKVYAMMDDFSRGMDTSDRLDRVKKLYREMKKQLRNREDIKSITHEQMTMLRKVGKKARNHMTAAYEAHTRAEAEEALAKAEAIFAETPLLNETVLSNYITMAGEYRKAIAAVDISKRGEYAESFEQVKVAIEKLLGPRPGQPMPLLAQNQFGATRMDMAHRELDNLLYQPKWVADAPGQPLRQVMVPRAEQFRGTPLEGLFSYVEQNLDAMLLPRSEFYWQYFIDDSTPGHYFGGAGPEIIGTVLLTVLPMLFAFPPCVIAAAWLARTTDTGIVIRVIRTCINTLAGVPSIVFGLVGLAFFVMWLQPALGLPSKGCVLAGSLTLAILIMPVIIRASEEAIRAVPQTYREAALGLGAGELRTFLTVTFPSALPGILTGVILSMGRAAGETAPILFCAAVASGPVPSSLMETTRTLSYGSYDIAVGDRLATQVPHQQYGMVMTLVLIVLILNLSAILLRWRIAKKLRGH